MAILHKHPHHHHARPAPKPLAVLKAGCTIRMYVRILDGGVALDWTDGSLSYKDVRIWSDPRKGYIGRPTYEVCEKDHTVLVAQYDTDAADLPGMYRLTVDVTYNGWQMAHTIPVYWLEGNIYCKCGAEYVEGCDTPVEHDVVLDLKGVSTTYLQNLIDEMIALRQDENERITTLELLMAKAMERLSCHARKIATLEERMTSAEERLDADEAELADHEAELADHEERITSAEETLKDYGERIETLEKDDADHEERITSLESEVTSIQNTITSMQSSITSIQSSITSINKSISSLQSDLSEMEACCKEVQARLDALESGSGSSGGNETVYYTLTIVPTPSDATVKMNGTEQSSVTVASGTTVSYTVSKEGYTSKSGSYTVNSDHTIYVTLEEENSGGGETETVTLTIIATPDDAEVSIVDETSGTGTASVTVAKGASLSWFVRKDGYVTQSGSLTITEDTTIYVTLEEENSGGGETETEYYTFSINPTPSDATVTINGAEIGADSDGLHSVTVAAGSTVTWTVSRDGYVSKSGTWAVTEDYTLDVVLEEEEVESDTVTFTINATPSTAIVTINGRLSLSAGTGTVTLARGDAVTWTVTCDGYVSQDGSLTVTEDTVLDIVLLEDAGDATDPDIGTTYVTVKVKIYPTDVTATLSMRPTPGSGGLTNEIVANDSEVSVPTGTYTWTAEAKSGSYTYSTASGTITINGDTEITLDFTDDSAQDH